MCCSSLGCVLTPTHMASAGQRALSSAKLPTPSLALVQVAPAGWCIAMCWPVMAVGCLPDGCRKTWHSEEGIEWSAGALLGRAQAGKASPLTLECVVLLLINVQHQASVLMGCCGLDLPQLASQS